MWKYIVICFVCWLLIPAGYSAPPPANPYMAQMHEHLNALAPILFSIQDFADSRNEELIAEHLQGFEMATLQMEHRQIFSKNLGTSVLFDILTRSISDASRAFYDGNKNYSRIMLQSALSTCVSCHTSGANAKAFHFLSEKKLYDSLPSDNARIELYFTTRQFAEGKKVAESVLENYPGNAARLMSLAYATEQLATYYARLVPDAQKASVYFKSLSARESFPFEVRQDLSDLAAGFKKLKQVSTNPKLSTTAKLQRIKQNIGYKTNETLLTDAPSHAVLRLQAVGELHKLLAANRFNSATELAETLHLLGLVNNILNTNLVTQTDDAYFAVCIETTPHSSTAVRCYQSLEDSLTLKSSGSGGAFFDLEDLRMLARYKRLAYPLFPKTK